LSITQLGYERRFLENVAAAIGVPLALLIGGKLVGRHRDRLRFRRACEQLLLRLG
jgi:hypothetical protein